LVKSEVSNDPAQKMQTYSLATYMSIEIDSENLSQMLAVSIVEISDDLSFSLNGHALVLPVRLLHELLVLQNCRDIPCWLVLGRTLTASMFEPWGQLIKVFAASGTNVHELCWQSMFNFHFFTLQ
jgi:hypothetical protein